MSPPSNPYYSMIDFHSNQYTYQYLSTFSTICLVIHEYAFRIRRCPFHSSLNTALLEKYA